MPSPNLLCRPKTKQKTNTTQQWPACVYFYDSLCCPGVCLCAGIPKTVFLGSSTSPAGILYNTRKTVLPTSLQLLPLLMHANMFVLQQQTPAAASQHQHLEKPVRLEYKTGVRKG